MPMGLLIRCVCVLVVPLTMLILAPPAAGAERPNVLFIGVDDLNDWITPLGGYPGVRTPNFQRLAERGMTFTRAYCAAPLCNPSRAAVLTGRRPSTSGVYGNSQPWRQAMPEAVTLPQHFMQHGYKAVGSGKMFHSRFHEPESWHDYLPKGLDPQPPQAVLDDPRHHTRRILWAPLDVADEEMNDYRMASYAVEFLKQQHDSPFFLAYGIFRPHLPWHVPRKHFEMYPLEEIILPDVPDDELDDVPPAGVRMAAPEGDHAAMLATGNWKRAVQGYLASITFVDAQLGRVLDALDDSPYAENTIIVLWSDHGWHLGEKHHWQKFALWEEATRVPLLVSVPGMTPPDSRCERTVDLMSLYPTLSELCGLPVADRLDGVSLVPLLQDPQAEWEHTALMTHGRGNHAVRSERYRYIRYADGSEELYDHQADANEWTNLAGESKYAPVKEDLARWLPQHEAPEAALEDSGP